MSQADEKDKSAPADPFLVAVQALSASMIELDHTIEMIALVEKDIAVREQERKAEIRAQATGGAKISTDDASSVVSHGAGSNNAEAMLRTSHLEVAPPRASAAEISANIASKRKATLGAAAFLRQSAARLSSVALADRRFFSQLSDLRKRWLLCVVDASGRDASGDAVGEDGARGRAADGSDGSGRKGEASKGTGGASRAMGERFVLRSANNLAFDCGLFSAGGSTGGLDGGDGVRAYGGTRGASSDTLWSGAAARGRARVLTQIRRTEDGRLEVLPPAAPLGPGIGGSLGATGASGGSYAHLALRVTVTMATKGQMKTKTEAEMDAGGTNGGEAKEKEKGAGRGKARRKRKREDDEDSATAESTDASTAASTNENNNDVFISRSATIRAAPLTSTMLAGNEVNEMTLRRVRHSALCSSIFDALAAEAAALGDMVGDAGAGQVQVQGQGQQRHATWRGSGAGWISTALPLHARNALQDREEDWDQGKGEGKGEGELEEEEEEEEEEEGEKGERKRLTGKFPSAGAGPFSLFSVLQSTASAVEVRVSAGLRLRVELVRDGDGGIGEMRGGAEEAKVGAKVKVEGKEKEKEREGEEASRLAATALASTAAAALHSAAMSGFRRRRRERRVATLLIGMDPAGAMAARRRLLRDCGPGLVLFPAVLRLRHRERGGEVAAELARLSASSSSSSSSPSSPITWSRCERSVDQGQGNAAFLSTSWRLAVGKRVATVTLRTFRAVADNAWAWDANGVRRSEAFYSSATRSTADSMLATDLDALPGLSCAVVSLSRGGTTAV